MEPRLRVLSLGAGVQSTALALMAAHGEIGPMPDAMIFADTQWEPAGVYEHLDWLEGEVVRRSNGRLPLHRVTRGNIRDDHIAGLNSTGQRFASMPLFTANGAGMGRRQCTREYKVEPITQKIRELLGMSKGQRVPAGVIVEQWIGISTDEAVRMKPARERWVSTRWPLIEQGLARHHCQQWFAEHYPGRRLAKSACIGCPYHSDTMWRDMKLTDPESWRDAVEFDKAIRDNGSTFKGMDAQQFLHRSGRPLDEVDLRSLEDLGQINLFGNECEGMCGV